MERGNEARIYVGCCGYPVARRRYYELFKTVEIQQTFYNLPLPETARKWRDEAPPDFVFNMKAWQVITHPPSSPTWRRLRAKPPGQLGNYGLLRPTEENLSAWRKTVEIAHILQARVIVLQTPPSFGYSPDNARQVDGFFSKVKEVSGNTDVIIGWEPRGSWREALNYLEKIVCRHNIVHIVDPLRQSPVICSGQRVLYFRLHGLGGREVNYRYKYSDSDLARLLDVIKKYLYERSSINEVYVMFNNVYMLDDSQRFKLMAQRYFENSVIEVV